MENIKILPMTNLMKDGEAAPEHEMAVKCKGCDRSFHIDGEQAASGLFTGFVCEECKPSFEKEVTASTEEKSTEVANTVAAALGN